MPVQLTQEEQDFIKKGADFFNNAFSEIPNERAIAVKQALLTELQKTNEQTTASIKNTVISGIDFVDAGFHLVSNTKGVEVVDAIDQAADAFRDGKSIGLIKILGLFFKLKSV